MSWTLTIKSNSFYVSPCSGLYGFIFVLHFVVSTFKRSEDFSASVSEAESVISLLYPPQVALLWFLVNLEWVPWIGLTMIIVPYRPGILKWSRGSREIAFEKAATSSGSSTIYGPSRVGSLNWSGDDRYPLPAWNPEMIQRKLRNRVWEIIHIE